MLATHTLEDVRDIAANAVMRLGSYDPTEASEVKRLDYAIKAAGEEMYLRVQYTRLVDNSLTTTPDQYFIDLSSIADFEASRFLRLEIVDPSDENNLYRYKAMDYSYVRRAIQSNRAQTGAYYTQRPYSSAGFGHVCAIAPAADKVWFNYPPESAWEVRIHYRPRFVQFDAGTGTPDAVTINIPDNQIYGFCYYMIPYFYDMGQSGQNPNLELRKREYLSKVAGQNRVGARVIQADERDY